MLNSIPLGSLDKYGWNAPINGFESPFDPTFLNTFAAARLRHDLTEGRFLDALLVSKQSDVLVVSFHGAINRGKVALPRFERLATLKNLEVNSMYFGDPSLWLDSDISISWYTGWLGGSIQEKIATEVKRAATKLGCSKVIIVGDSGGGFAALQVSALLPDSVCVAFNPTTTLHNYFDGGNPRRTNVQRNFLRVVLPHLIESSPEDFDTAADWSRLLSNDFSALHRYSQIRKNWVILIQNINDWHYKQHYFPFLAAAAKGNNLFRIQTMEYTGKRGHTSPSKELYESGIMAGLNFADVVFQDEVIERLSKGFGVLRG